MNKRQKLWLKISISFLLLGTIIMSIVAYFLIQSIREVFYQRAFEKQYDYVSLEEEGSIDAVQVFHGVKINTYVESESNASIVLEINDEVEAKIKGLKVDPEEEGMQPFSNVIQYKSVTDIQSGKEQFIVSLQTTPANKRDGNIKYRAYTINENGIVKKSNFTASTKSKLETQWIRGIPEVTQGYYTNVPYQDGSVGAILFLTLIGLASIAGGVLLRRAVIINERSTAA
ncbi:hypothetical protein [Rossellomorea aquimaris]|uniref:hypothetical protein n=1 Tax=Rossellomorea aquimaris TaxID=189382 RepID=UPI0011E8C167|nr:hypothetical protein [Rossellomorea aquimaris]TYS85232.1 hypothetical protein FZC88_21530 [Rossellomorea aquimaris]